ncbi:MAG: phenylalanine--tRNA ligase subunit beta [Candidatus Nealsonbacteria bacterium RBG_13_38_11]|uniref:Phenylalanine--tRNA ligase beta subunit n=1 Tax=Candidatus Nealsonbacteria bacterium RBG_13_38_11 TaxID=1801662 RepID=A0A1G2E0Q2_9BACT|nr:MAG: phenylalanine--tRNA ligase subunit beta [Candidatus Nealsonbacteria bacterium RBG_13_38_11]
MLFSYNWLQSFFDKKLPQAKHLSELLTKHFAEVEEIKKNGNDYIFDIDIRPNRASDCFSHMGIAREISAILNYQIKRFPSVKNTAGKQASVKVEVLAKSACPRYTARLVKDIKVGPSPKWLSDELKICGLRPINNIVDIANYVMLETGQPLHAFDAEKLAEGKIVVRFAKDKEKIVTLEDQKFNLSPDVLVIADSNHPIAIAGIKGGKSPEIGKSTKTIILESANFNPQVIRKSSKKLNLRTDASLRFEHGIDPNLTESAINRAAFLIGEIAGGKTAGSVIDVYPKKVLAKMIKLDLAYVERLLGIKISSIEIKKILERLGFEIKNSQSKIFYVKVPTFRLDVSLPEDLIEEIGRIYGYDRIPLVSPISYLIPAKRNLNVFWEDFVKNVLKEAGFIEAYNYSFFGEKEAKLFGYKEKELVQVENPLNQEYEYLRASLIPGLLKNVEKNISNFNNFKIFELGKVFKYPLIEKRQLSGLILDEEFYYLKGVVDLIFEKLGIGDVWYDEHQPTPEQSSQSIWHDRKCAEIKVNGKEIGFLGEISLKILSVLGIKNKVILFDIDFEKLSQLSSEEQEYRPISRFPSAIRDIAVLVPKDVKVAEILNKIYEAGGKAVRNVELFDLYEGREMPEGKKNLAFHIIYQVGDRTLSSSEIDSLQRKVIKSLEKEQGWKVRK